MKTITLTILFLMSVASMPANAECTEKATRTETGSWIPVRHLLGNGKAKCFESKCTIKWQDYNESSCPSKIIKKDCAERNVREVPADVSC